MKKTIFLFTLLFITIHSGAQEKLNIMLTGASFGVTQNGWFEIGCNTYGAVGINKSVSGEAIYHTANRMATNTFYTKAELEKTDVFIIMHVHNQNVANETLLKEDYTEYTMPTTNYAVAYDYVIKRYKDDCYKLKDDINSKYYGTENGKPAIITLCTHWHDSRTIYNSAIRVLSQKWSLPLIEWDKNIGFSKDILINGVQPSLQYAMDNEVIGGVTYGWHPLRGQNQYLQKKLAEIFVAGLETTFGALPVGVTINNKSKAIMPNEEAFVSFSFTGLPPWKMKYQVNDQFVQLDNITENPLLVKVSVPAGKATKIKPVGINNNSVSEGTVTGEAVIYNANKSIYPIFDTYAHQANNTTAYTTDTVVQVKTTTDNYSREAFFTFNLSNLKSTEEKIIFRAFFYQRVYPQNKNILEDHLVEIAGVAANYSTLNWDSKPVNLTIINESNIFPSELGSYISWDITDWTKEQIALGKSNITLRLKVINEGTGLLNFCSSEATTQHHPEILADATSANALNLQIVEQVNVYPNPFNESINMNGYSPIEQLSITSVDGKCFYKKNKLDAREFSINTTNFPLGLYLIQLQTGNQRIVRKLVKF